LRLASFRAYASSIALPQHLQGSIPGPWLAATGAGLPPARLRGIAKPLQYASPITPFKTTPQTPLLDVDRPVRRGSRHRSL
jgi:hypothetical protein